MGGWWGVDSILARCYMNFVCYFPIHSLLGLLESSETFFFCVVINFCVFSLPFSYIDFPPAQSVENDDELAVPKGTCVTNENSMLLSCAGTASLYGLGLMVMLLPRAGTARLHGLGLMVMLLPHAGTASLHGLGLMVMLLPCAGTASLHGLGLMVMLLACMV